PLDELGPGLLQPERALLQETRRGQHLVGLGQAGLGRHAAEQGRQWTQLLVDLRTLRIAVRLAPQQSLQAGLARPGRRALGVELRYRPGPLAALACPSCPL